MLAFIPGRIRVRSTDAMVLKAQPTEIVRAGDVICSDILSLYYRRIRFAIKKELQPLRNNEISLGV